MNEENAMKIARGGGNIIGKALYGKGKITLKLMYLESREVILDLYYQPTPLMRWLLKKEEPNRPSQKIRMMVEGTRCGASYAGEDLSTCEIEVEDSDSVQNTEYSNEKIIQAAKRLALRMVRRQIGKIATAEVSSMRSVYRPYYIAFYGDMKLGEKVRYLSIAADGSRVERTF